MPTEILTADLLIPLWRVTQLLYFSVTVALLWGIYWLVTVKSKPVSVGGQLYICLEQQCKRCNRLTVNKYISGIKRDKKLKVSQNLVATLLNKHIQPARNICNMAIIFIYRTAHNSASGTIAYIKLIGPFSSYKRNSKVISSTTISSITFPHSWEKQSLCDLYYIQTFRRWRGKDAVMKVHLDTYYQISTEI